MSASRLRIAMLSVHSCPVGNIGAKDTGGMSIYIRELASELSKQGHLVDIYTRAHDPRDKQIVELGKNTRLIHLEAGEVEDIHKLVMYSYLLDFACNSENFRRRNHLRYDLVFSHYWLSGRVGEYLRGWWHVPHIVMFHTLGAVKNAIGIGEDEPELRLEAERDLAQNCHHIIAATEKEKSDLLRHCGASPDRIGVIPCGVNLELFRPVDKELAKKRDLFLQRSRCLRDPLLLRKLWTGSPGIPSLRDAGSGYRRRQPQKCYSPRRDRICGGRQCSPSPC